MYRIKSVLLNNSMTSVTFISNTEIGSMSYHTVINFSLMANYNWPRIKFKYHKFQS